MESKKGYYIDIVGGTVKTAEEIEIETACKNATALVELSQLKALLNEYFCLYNIFEPHTNLEKLGFEISLREQSIDYVIYLLKGGANNG